MISPHNEWYIGNALVCAHFSSKLANGTYCLCSITQLFRLLGIIKIFISYSGNISHECFVFIRQALKREIIKMIMTHYFNTLQIFLNGLGR